MTGDKKDDHQSKRLLPWARLVLATGVILVLLPCLGLVGSVVYLRARQAGAFSRWRSLGALPDNGIDIVTGDVGVVYVVTAAGSIYGCRHRGTRVADDCWYETQEPLSVDQKARFDKSLYQREVEPPVGTVVDTLEVTVWQAEDAFEVRYILLEDGTVWKWEYDVGSYLSLFIIILGPIAGVALGIVVVVILWTGVGLRRLQHRIKEKESPAEPKQPAPPAQE